MDGYKSLLALKEHLDAAGGPVILETLKASLEEEVKALQAGFIDFIGKPILPVRVISGVQRALHRKTYANEQQTAT
jgi:DNA-binding NtrC family response regulator